MVQQGVAVTVACFPTLRSSINDISLESVIRSIRSQFSLHSLSSKTSNHTLRQDKQQQRRDHPFNDSVTAFANKPSLALAMAKVGNPESEHVETHIMSELGRRGIRHDAMPESKIRVDKDMIQSIKDV